MSRLTAEGISAAMSLGDDVIAVTVVLHRLRLTDDGAATRPSASEWQAWRPEVPLLTLRSAHRSLAKPIVSLPAPARGGGQVPPAGRADPGDAADQPLAGAAAQPAGHHPRTARSAAAPANVVLCRLRYRLETVVDDADAPAERASRSPPRAPE